jgi:ethanolamine utilization protein EutP (predicted NTPase)
LFAKVTPAHAEATVFAFITSMENASSTFGSKFVGIAINKMFVGVTTKNMDQFWVLIII